MKLDVNVLRYLSREDFRVLVAVEMGQKNVSASCVGCGVGPARPAMGSVKRRHAATCCSHMPVKFMLRPVLLQHEIVPATLIDTIAGLK